MSSISEEDWQPRIVAEIEDPPSLTPSQQYQRLRGLLADAELTVADGVLLYARHLAAPTGILTGSDRLTIKRLCGAAQADGMDISLSKLEATHLLAESAADVVQYAETIATSDRPLEQRRDELDSLVADSARREFEVELDALEAVVPEVLEWSPTPMPPDGDEPADSVAPAPSTLDSTESAADDGRPGQDEIATADDSDTASAEDPLAATVASDQTLEATTGASSSDPPNTTPSAADGSTAGSTSSTDPSSKSGAPSPPASADETESENTPTAEDGDDTDTPGSESQDTGSSSADGDPFTFESGAPVHGGVAPSKANIDPAAPGQDSTDNASTSSGPSATGSASETKNHQRADANDTQKTDRVARDGGTAVSAAEGGTSPPGAEQASDTPADTPASPSVEAPAESPPGDGTEGGSETAPAVDLHMSVRPRPQDTNPGSSHGPGLGGTPAARDLVDFEYVYDQPADPAHGPEAGYPDDIDHSGMIVLDADQKEYAAIAEITPRSWVIHTEQFKEKIIRAYKQSFLRPLDYDIQLVMMPTQFSLEPHYERLREARENPHEDDNKFLTLGREMEPDWLQEYMAANEVRQSSFYVVVRVTAAQVEQFDEGTTSLASTLLEGLEDAPMVGALVDQFTEDPEDEITEAQCLRELDKRLEKLSSGVKETGCAMDPVTDREEVLSVLHHYYNHGNPHTPPGAGGRVTGSDADD